MPSSQTEPVCFDHTAWQEDWFKTSGRTFSNSKEPSKARSLFLYALLDWLVYFEFSSYKERLSCVYQLESAWHELEVRKFWVELLLTIVAIPMGSSNWTAQFDNRAFELLKKQ